MLYSPHEEWFREEYEWDIEVTGFLRGDQTEGYCQNGEEIGDDLRNIGGSTQYTKEIVCPDGCVIFRMTARKSDGTNFFTGESR